MISDMTPSEFYKKYEKDRTPYETRAYQYAELTLPYIISKPGRNASTQTVYKRAQGFCAKQVNLLKSKIGMALLPPSSSSFRFAPDEKALQQIGVTDASREQLYAELSKAQATINKEIEAQQVRGSLFEIIAHQLIVGSVLVEKLPREGLLLHPLKSFTVKLGRTGKPEAFCFVEKLHTLPDGITSKEEKEEYELYTMVYFDNESKKWIEKQELDGEIVGKERTFKDYIDVPYRYLGWTWATGDKYHRPYIEDLYPDMEQLNYLAELLTRGSLAAAKVTFLVNEQQGFTDKRELEESLTGAYVHGRESDVGVVQAKKNYDFQVPMERESALKNELAEAFLSNKSATRQAERVTAYEVQLMAQELESSTLGGIYSSMSLEFSRWIVHQIMKELGIKFESQALNNVKILTGLDALGRSQESKQLDAYLQRVGALQAMDRINQGEVLRRYAEYENIETEGLIKTDAEVAKEREMAQQQMAQQQAQESVASKAGDMVQQAVAPNQ